MEKSSATASSARGVVASECGRLGRTEASRRSSFANESAQFQAGVQVQTRNRVRTSYSWCHIGGESTASSGTFDSRNAAESASSLAVTFSQDVRNQQSVRPATAAVQTAQLSTTAVPYRNTGAVPTSQPIPVQSVPNLPSIPSTSVQPPLQQSSQQLPAAPPARSIAGFQPRLQSRPIGGTLQSRPVGGVPQLQLRPLARPNVQAPVGASQQQFGATNSSSTGYPVARTVIPPHPGTVGMNITIANANASSNVNLIRNIKQEPLDDMIMQSSMRTMLNSIKGDLTICRF